MRNLPTQSSNFGIQSMSNIQKQQRQTALQLAYKQVNSSDPVANSVNLSSLALSQVNPNSSRK
jgi:hypothetical protein